MRKFSVNIDGIPTEIETHLIDVNNLILDETNPRIGQFKDSQIAEHLNTDEIIFALTQKNPDAFNKLKESIEINDGAINPIWVMPLENKEKYLVVEGNTRVVVYWQLKEKYPNKPTWKKILSNVLPHRIQDSQKDFIKLEAHLRGTTDWDAYEKARYLYKLSDREGYSIPRLEKLTKMSKNEILLAIQAFKDMEQQYLPKYKNDPYQVQKHSYFVEYERNKKLIRLMEQNDLSITDFCNWVGTGKVPSAQKVRDLPNLLENEKIKKIFLEKGYEIAIQQLSIAKPDLTSRLFQDIERVIDGLNNLTNYEINEIKDGNQPGKEKLIKELFLVSKRTKEIIEKK